MDQRCPDWKARAVIYCVLNPFIPVVLLVMKHRKQFYFDIVTENEKLCSTALANRHYVSQHFQNHIIAQHHILSLKDRY